MTDYRVFLADGRSTELSAAKVFFGWQRFYLYDESNQVVGTFLWEQLSGFQTTSVPVNQIILQDTDDLPQDRKSKKEEDKEAALKQQKGELIYELEAVTQQLTKTALKLSSVWLLVNNFRRSKTNELNVVLATSKGEMQRLQAALKDTHNDIDRRVKQLSEEIARALKGDSEL